jgi:hypothetical protein
MVDKILDLIDLGRPLRRATCDLKDATCRGEAIIEELEREKTTPPVPIRTRRRA